VVVGGIWLCLLNRRTRNRKLEFELETIALVSRRKTVLYLGLFVVIFLSVLRVIDYRLVTVMVLLAVLFWTGTCSDGWITVCWGHLYVSLSW
jgi:hypothetical protein